MKKEIETKDNRLMYYNYDLLELVKEFKTPLKITFLDVIKEKVQSLKSVYDEVINKKNYQGKFIYVNANKANYGCFEIETAYKYSDGLECSSYNDLLLTKAIVNKYPNPLEKPIICNGFKQMDYINEIVDMTNDGYNITTIIDCIDEYNIYKATKYSKPCQVGLRIHLPSLYSEEYEVVKNDRFGLMKEEFDFIINDISNYPDLNLTTIHFHQRGFDYEKDKFILNIQKSFIDYYVKAKKMINSVVNFDMGGGTPLPATKDFNYYSWAELLIDTLSDLCNKYGIDHPNIISENGKYSQKDSTVTIYKVVGIKNTDQIPWYLLDGSPLIAMPELYALGEEIIVTQINLLDKDLIPARLAGITCDCDDIFFDKKLGYMLLPKISKDDDLYIGLLGTGSYQNSMNGKGGVHHCLLPEEKDVVVYTSNDKIVHYVRNDLQNIEDMKRILDINKKL